MKVTLDLQAYPQVPRKLTYKNLSSTYSIRIKPLQLTVSSLISEHRKYNLEAYTADQEPNSKTTTKINSKKILLLKLKAYIED